jgi:hypothetical protein
VALVRRPFIAGKDRGYVGVFVPKNPFIAQPFQYRISRRPFPSQLTLGVNNQFGRRYRAFAPYKLRKLQLRVGKVFVLRHIITPDYKY